MMIEKRLVYAQYVATRLWKTTKGYGCVNYRNGCKFAIWKDDQFFKNIHKDVSKPMAEKLLKDKYCLVKLMEQEEEVVENLTVRHTQWQSSLSFIG